MMPNVAESLTPSNNGSNNHRKPWTRSRLGCKQCKRRRVKCDETPPCCGPCARNHLPCDYDAAGHGALNNIQVITPQTIVGHQRVRKLSKQQFTDSRRSSQDRGDAEEDHGRPSDRDRQLSHVLHREPASTFTLDDLRLIHHFTIHTYHTLPPVDDEKYRQVWQEDVPRLAHSNPFLMHAVLAMSAAHLGAHADEHNNDDQRLQHFHASRRHYGRSMALFVDTMKDITPAHADVILAFCFLTTVLTLHLDTVQSPSAGPTGADIDRFADFLCSLHGAVRLLGSMREPLRSSPVGVILRHLDQYQRHAIDTDADASIDFLTASSRAASKADLNVDSSPVLEIAVRQLRDFFTLSAPRPETWAHILAWAMALPPDFPALLRRRNRVALCILAHWCVPLNNAYARWFLGDWPERLMRALAEEVGDDPWREVMRWPLEQTVGDRDREERGDGEVYMKRTSDSTVEIQSRWQRSIMLMKET